MSSKYYANKLKCINKMFSIIHYCLDSSKFKHVARFSVTVTMSKMYPVNILCQCSLQGSRCRSLFRTNSWRWEQKNKNFHIRKSTVQSAQVEYSVKKYMHLKQLMQWIMKVLLYICLVNGYFKHWDDLVLYSGTLVYYSLSGTHNLWTHRQYSVNCRLF